MNFQPAEKFHRTQFIHAELVNIGKKLFDLTCLITMSL